MTARKAAERTVFSVRGAFTFPVDMLRYDACYPAREVDAAAIARTFDRDAYAETIWLETYAPKITTERWESFGWRVQSGLSHRGSLPAEAGAR